MAQQYTPEEQAAAWAAYYASQGYDMSSYYASNTSVGPATSTSMAGPSAVPMAPAPAGPSRPPTYGHGQGSSWDPEAAQQAQAYNYVPAAGASTTSGAGMGAPLDPSIPTLGSEKGKGKGKSGNAASGTHGAVARETVIRKSGGKVWEDKTLLEWDPAWFRLFVGDLANDIREHNLDAAFQKYPSYAKSKVVRNHLSDKAQYGFIAFKDPEDYLKAWKEMDNKYVGSRPIRLMKVREDKYGGVKGVAIGAKKSKELERIAKNKFKPFNNRPTPW